MIDIKKTCGFSGRPMLFSWPTGILNWHLPSGKWNHPSTVGDMPVE
jgi:hypothetical protein